MDRLGSALGSAVRTGTGARLPSLYGSAATLGRGLAEETINPTGAFFATHMTGMAAPSSGFGNAVASSIARLLGENPGWGGIAAAFGQQMGGAVGAPFQPGSAAFRDPQWGQAAGAINAAAAKYGVPAGFLAAIIKHESSGNWQRDGNRYVYLPSRNTNILPYIGFTDPATRAFGVDPRSLIGNQAGQIDLLARALRSWYDKPNIGGRYGWAGVSNYHYSGDPSGGSTPADSWQYGSTNQYTRNVLSWWRSADPNMDPNARPGGPGSLGSSFGSGMDAISTMLGGATARISQEFGLTEFSKNHLNGMYSYATRYGGQGHVGLDISLPVGTRQFSPVAGTVIRTGGTGYYTDERYGNRPGTGELRIKLDNGDEVILGHLGNIGVQVGQRVNPGDFVGLSGTANGGHTHLEYRRYTPGATASGYTAVDPRQALGGAFSSPSLFGTSAPQRALGSSISDAARIVWDSGFRNSYS